VDREDVEHELRTPLTTIKGVLRLLAVGRLAEFSPRDASDLLDRAWQQLIKLEKVVANVEAQFVSRAEDEVATVVYEESSDAEGGFDPARALVLEGSPA
jgi:K+-sensing histidine kinase KdpD